MNMSLESEVALVTGASRGIGKAIALALASERPDWFVTATDIYAPTLDVAKETGDYQSHLDTLNENIEPFIGPSFPPHVLQINCRFFKNIELYRSDIP